MRRNVDCSTSESGSNELLTVRLFMARLLSRGAAETSNATRCRDGLLNVWLIHTPPLADLHSPDSAAPPIERASTPGKNPLDDLFSNYEVAP